MAILNQQVKDKVQKSILPTKKPTPVLGKVTPPALSFHHPDASEGAGMWELVKETGVLELNSSYLYLMMGRYYGQTCLVAKQNGKVRGFVMGFIPPERDDTYFSLACWRERRRPWSGAGHAHDSASAETAGL